MKGLSLGPRAQAVVVLGLVAALGALLGILGDRYVAQQRVRDSRDVVDVRRPPRDGPERGPYIDRIADRLDLTDQQRAAIDTILAQQQLQVRALTREFQPQFRAIATETRQRVEAVLTPEQRELMRGMRRERLRRLGTERPGFQDAVRPRPGEGRMMPPDTSP